MWPDLISGLGNSKPNDYITRYPTVLLEYIDVTAQLVDYAENWLANVCDQACENGLYECKLHWVIFLVIFSVQIIISHFHKLQKKAH